MPATDKPLTIDNEPSLTVTLNAAVALHIAHDMGAEALAVYVALCISAQTARQFEPHALAESVGLSVRLVNAQLAALCAAELLFPLYDVNPKTGAQTVRGYTLRERDDRLAAVTIAAQPVVKPKSTAKAKRANGWMFYPHTPLAQTLAKVCNIPMEGGEKPDATTMSRANVLYKLGMHPEEIERLFSMDESSPWRKWLAQQHRTPRYPNAFDVHDYYKTLQETYPRTRKQTETVTYEDWDGSVVSATQTTEVADNG